MASASTGTAPFTLNDWMKELAPLRDTHLLVLCDSLASTAGAVAKYRDKVFIRLEEKEPCEWCETRELVFKGLMSPYNTPSPTLNNHIFKTVKLHLYFYHKHLLAGRLAMMAKTLFSSMEQKKSDDPLFKKNFDLASGSVTKATPYCLTPEQESICEAAEALERACRDIPETESIIIHRANLGDPKSLGTDAAIVWSSENMTIVAEWSEKLLPLLRVLLHKLAAAKNEPESIINHWENKLFFDVWTNSKVPNKTDSNWGQKYWLLTDGSHLHALIDQVTLPHSLVEC